MKKNPKHIGCLANRCENKHSARGWCSAHYYYAIAHGREQTINHIISDYHRKRFEESDYIGKEFGYLTIIKFTENKRVKNGSQFTRCCLCKCKCGDEREYALNNIKSGYSKSCGCRPPNYKKYSFRVSKHPLHSIWLRIMRVCYNSEYKHFKDYGGRGIDVHYKWHNVETFLIEAQNILGIKPGKDYSIDRIDNDRGYFPDNIRWATGKQQKNNTRLTGKLTMQGLAKATGYTRERIRQLTYKTSSDIYTKIFPLKDYIDYKIVNHYIYRTEAIQFLKNRRLGVR